MNYAVRRRRVNLRSVLLLAWPISVPSSSKEFLKAPPTRAQEELFDGYASGIYQHGVMMSKFLTNHPKSSLRVFFVGKEWKEDSRCASSLTLIMM